MFGLHDYVNDLNDAPSQKRAKQRSPREANLEEIALKRTAAAALGRLWRYTTQRLQPLAANPEGRAPCRVHRDEKIKPYKCNICQGVGNRLMSSCVKSCKNKKKKKNRKKFRATLCAFLSCLEWPA